MHASSTRISIPPFRLMTSEAARAAFDLSKEPQSVRERYGMNRVGSVSSSPDASSRTGCVS